MFKNTLLTPFSFEFISSGPIFDNKIEELILTKKELAEKLRFSVSYINKLMKQGKIPYHKLGRPVRFVYSEVLAALEKEST